MIIRLGRAGFEYLGPRGYGMLYCVMEILQKNIQTLCTQCRNSDAKMKDDIGGALGIFDPVSKTTDLYIHNSEQILCFVAILKKRMGALDCCSLCLCVNQYCVVSAML